MVDVLLLRHFDSKEDIQDVLDCITESWEGYSLAERLTIAERITEDNRDILSSAQLEQLADYLLAEELTDPHPDKVTRTEYPILTASQLKRRYRKSVMTGSEETDDFLNLKYNDHARVNVPHIHKRVTQERDS